MALSVNKKPGILAINDAISNYTSLIKSQKGSFVPAMDLDYRTYIVNLLDMAIEQSSEENKAIIFSEIVLPTRIGASDE